MISGYRFSERTITLLRSAGWYPSRVIDLADFEALLTREGYQVSPAAREFLEAFGGLTITYPYHIKEGISAELYIKPVLGTYVIGVDISEWCKAASVSSLCPVGLDTTHNDAIVIADTGQVYEGSFPFLDYVGANAVEAIENLLKGKGRIYRRILPTEK